MTGLASPIVARSAMQRATRPFPADDRQLVFDWDEMEFEARRLDPCQPVDLAANAAELLETRYFRRDSEGRITETFPQLCERVATTVAKAEWPYGRANAVNRWAARFYDALIARNVMPNSPTLMNAGLPAGQLFACFVNPLEDSMTSICESLTLQALIQKSGGGTGFDFSRLRPKDDIVQSTHGVASGPASFLLLYDALTAAVKQGGGRRGANMGVLRPDHPDIEEFIDLKLDGTTAHNFNLSVFASDAFMQAALAGVDFPLVNPRTAEIVRRIPAAELLRRMATNAWRTGDPGVLFADAINRANPTPAIGPICATNPCGEVPLLPYEACVLASVNLSNLVRQNGQRPTIDSQSLAYNVRLLVRFLDDAIDVSTYPHPANRRMVKEGNRKIGVGVMGFADALVKLGIPYASEEAVELADKLMRSIQEESRQASRELAAERGIFPNWDKSIYAEQGVPMRNATVTSVAPTGSIAIIAECSPSIEPLFALAFFRRVLNGRTLTELNPLFVEHAKQHGYYSDELIGELRQKGSVATIDGVPEHAKRLFATALEIHPSWHLRMQAAFQRHCCNAVSKTINLPETATPDDVLDIYRRAWELQAKGVTVYRYGSKSEQVMNLGIGDERASDAQETAAAACPRCVE